VAPVFLLKLYALTLPVFLAVDLLWLGVVARGFFPDPATHAVRGGLVG
jgi:hypothetical protein